MLKVVVERVELPVAGVRSIVIVVSIPMAGGVGLIVLERARDSVAVEFLVS